MIPVNADELASAKARLDSLRAYIEADVVWQSLTVLALLHARGIRRFTADGVSPRTILISGARLNLSDITERALSRESFLRDRFARS